MIKDSLCYLITQNPLVLGLTNTYFPLFLFLFIWKQFRTFTEKLIAALYMKNELSEAVVQRCSVKKVFLEISQNSQENTCARVFFNKVDSEKKL